MNHYPDAITTRMEGYGGNQLLGFCEPVRCTEVG
jgi:hypothetical protein